MGVARIRRYLQGFAASLTVVFMSLVNVPAAHFAPHPPAHPPTPNASAQTAIPSNTRLTAIYFRSISFGYAIFEVQGPTVCNDHVGLTTNGGATFSKGSGPIVSWRCASNAPVSALVLNDRGDGFLFGPKLFVTHDDGRTWSPSHQDGSVLSVEVVGSSIWMLETRQPLLSSATNNSTNPLLLLSSTNGGRTWSVLSTPPGAVAQPANSGGTGWLVRISRASAYLASSPRIRNGRRDPVTPLWFTTDSGATWSSRTIPCSDVGANVALSAAPDGTLFDVCASQPGAGQQLKETVRSTNEGRNWQIRSMCHFSSSNVLHCTPGSQSSGYLGEIDAVSAHTVYLVGDRSPLEVSRDGGIKWMMVPPGLGSSAGGTFQVHFFSPSAGIVFGDGDRENERPTLWTTTDGGTHWTTQVPVYN